MSPKSWTFVTGNPAKASQIERYLDLPIHHQKLELAELQSLELTEVVEAKVMLAWEALGVPVMVEDTGLRFEAMGRLPGPLIKWFYEELGNQGLCDQLHSGSRAAMASTVFGLYDGKHLQLCEGRTHGSIALTPRGPSVFGWDPIFIPSGWDLTWAEMTPEQQAQTSMRRKALDQVRSYLLS